jgi:hypothetical protein
MRVATAVLFVVSLQLFTTLAVEVPLQEICDKAAKRCVVRATYDSPYNNIFFYIGGNGLGSVGSGWTFLIDPTNYTCTPKADCSYANRTTYANASLAGTANYELSLVTSEFDNITIDSLYPDDARVQFKTSKNTALYNGNAAPKL